MTGIIEKLSDLSEVEKEESEVSITETEIETTKELDPEFSDEGQDLEINDEWNQDTIGVYERSDKAIKINRESDSVYERNHPTMAAMWREIRAKESAALADESSTLADESSGNLEISEDDLNSNAELITKELCEVDSSLNFDA